MYKKLSVLIPVYNEEKTIKKCVERVLVAKILNMNLEVIISDNNSTDNTKEILKSIKDPRIKLLFKENNEGKGANIKNALNHATGDIVLFQDADLEYSPENFEDLLRPFFENEAEVVFGTRLSRAKTTRITGFPNYIANKIITFLTNFLYNKIFSDISTG
jgi:glycosyltransferase involved in cell wall biosynthesis